MPVTNYNIVIFFISMLCTHNPSSNTCFILSYSFVHPSQYDQLPVDLIAQLVEHCTGIAEVMGLNAAQARLFFQALFLQLLKLHKLLGRSFFYMYSIFHLQFKYMFHTFIFTHKDVIIHGLYNPTRTLFIVIIMINHVEFAGHTNLIYDAPGIK